MPLEFELSLAGVPFLSVEGGAVRFPAPGPLQGKDKQPLSKLPAMPSVLEEVERLMPFRQMNEMVMPTGALGGELGPIGVKKSLGADDTSNIKIGEWFYPTTASRWSVFRGLMTSSMVKAVLSATSGLKNPGTFKMMANPITPGHSDSDQNSYTVSTQMYCLPPRCLGETAGSRDGLYLVTLVDDRWYFQGLPAAVTIDASTTWDTLLQDVAGALGISLSYDSIPAAYGVPNPQILCDIWKYGSVLLDVLAFNVGRVVVRKMDGTYTLEDANSSNAIVAFNRGNASRVVRMAGGDMFTTGQQLPVGDLSPARNAIVPNKIVVNFPQLLPTGVCCYNPEDMYSIEVPITSGGILVSGLTGVSKCSVFSPVNALYSSPLPVSGTIPSNASDLMALSLQTAQDFYGQQVVGSIDETYPGTYNWEPEGVHDIIWTYSEDLKRASTRVTRTEWNLAVRDLQGITCPSSQGSQLQTVRDSYSGTVTATLTVDMDPSSPQAIFNRADFFPTQNRWRGRIENEIVLFEGTSGTVNVDVAYRGIDGTLPVAHLAGSPIQEIQPHNTSGVLLITFEKGQFAYTQEYSGNVQGLRVVPQTQTVEAIDGDGGVMRGTTYYSGKVLLYDYPNENTLDEEYIWLVERNGSPLTSGNLYDGQFVGYSATSGSTPGVVGRPAPIYLVNETVATMGSGQTVEDSFDLTISTTIVNPITPSSTTVLLTLADYFPTQNCWRAILDRGQPNEERVLMAGTLGSTTATMVTRGLDGTAAYDHSPGAVLEELAPHTNAQSTITSYEKGQYVYSECSGALGNRVVPQTQSVLATTGIPTFLAGSTLRYYDGSVQLWDNTGFVTLESVWIIDRNDNTLTAGKYYDGQFAGYSPGTPRPCYLVNDERPKTHIVTSGLSGGCNYCVEPVCWTGSGFSIMSIPQRSGTASSGCTMAQEANCISGVQSGIVVLLNCVPDCFGNDSTCWFIYCCTQPPGSGTFVSGVGTSGMSGGGTSGGGTSGMSGGGGGGGGSITTLCCNGVYLPTNLTVHLSCPFGLHSDECCGCLNGTYTITWNGASWTGSFPGVCLGGITMNLICQTLGMVHQWKFSLNCGLDAVVATASSVSCDPVDILFDTLFLPGSSCCHRDDFPLGAYINVEITA